MNFNSIPIDIRPPGHYIEFDNTRAQQGLPAQPHKIVVCGQMLTAGTGTNYEPYRITSAAQAEELWGRGSMLASMFKALKNANSYTESWGIGLPDNGAGVAAAGSIQFAGTVTESGTLNLYIAGEPVRVGITSGQAPSAIATNVIAAINAQTDLPVTAAVGTPPEKVDITCRWKGETGNDIDIRLNYFFGEKIPKGLTATITAMTGGTSNPDCSTMFTGYDEPANTLIFPYTDAANLTLLENYLSDRWGPMVQKEGQAFCAAAGTHSTIATLGNSRNSPHNTTMGLQDSPTPTWIVAAVIGGIDAFEPDPARPRQTLHMKGVKAPGIMDRYTREERDLHLHDGISTFFVDDGGRVLIERLITTYQTNPFSVPDISYLDVTTMRTLAYLRYSVRSRIALKYPRHKLADNGTRTAPGQAVVTPNDIRNELVALFIDWEEAGLAEGREQFKTDLLVERDGTDPNRVNALIPPDVINQFRVFAASIQFRL